MEDRRAARTKKAIYEAFLGLLAEKPLNRITVAELSRAADLGRGTFYLHYRDVYDLYETITEEWYAELGRLYDDAFAGPEGGGSARFAETITTYILENRDKFLLLLQPVGVTVNKLRAFFNQKVMGNMGRQSAATARDAMETVFLVSGVVGVLEEWIDSGLALPQQEVAGMLRSFLARMNGEPQAE